MSEKLNKLNKLTNMFQFLLRNNPQSPYAFLHLQQLKQVLSKGRRVSKYTKKHLQINHNQDQTTGKKVIREANKSIRNALHSESHNQSGNTRKGKHYRQQSDKHLKQSLLLLDKLLINKGFNKHDRKKYLKTAGEHINQAQQFNAYSVVNRKESKKSKETAYSHLSKLTNIVRAVNQRRRNNKLTSPARKPRSSAGQLNLNGTRGNQETLSKNKLNRLKSHLNNAKRYARQSATHSYQKNNAHQSGHLKKSRKYHMKAIGSFMRALLCMKISPKERKQHITHFSHSLRKDRRNNHADNSLNVINALTSQVKSNKKISSNVRTILSLNRQYLKRVSDRKRQSRKKQPARPLNSLKITLKNEIRKSINLATKSPTKAQINHQETQVLKAFIRFLQGNGLKMKEERKPILKTFRSHLTEAMMGAGLASNATHSESNKTFGQAQLKKHHRAMNTLIESHTNHSESSQQNDLSDSPNRGLGM